MLKDGLTFVMGVNLIIWSGIALYLFILDKRIKVIETSIREKE
jgi:CcmD family protein